MSYKNRVSHCEWAGKRIEASHAHAVDAVKATYSKLQIYDQFSNKADHQVFAYFFQR